MRKYICLILPLAIMLFILCSGCKKEEAPAVDAGQKEAASDIPLPQITPLPTETPIPEAPPTAEVAQTAAYLFENDGQKTLYAAVEVKNTGTAPIIVRSMDITFKSGDTSEQDTFTPILYEDDMIQAGDSNCFAVWLPTGKKIDGDDLQASVQLQCESWASRHFCPLSVDKLYIVQNYPGFSSISGELINETDSDYSLSVVYVSFYDAQEKLLGTWHFSQNLSIPAGERRNFVNHMRLLPISGLAENTARITARGIGIQ